MTSPPPSITPAEPRSGTGDLGWLLVNFLEEVPGVDAGVLGTLDGLPLASAGLSEAKSAHLAAVATTQNSAGKAGGNIIDPPGGDVELVIVQLSRRYVFVMNTQQGTTGDTAVAGTLLTVLAAPDVDTRMVGNEMAALIKSVARHLGTTTRTATADGSVNAGPGDEA
ncbi:roadblock/LC7 domain-containing protein [Actinomadura sp. KC216]|uniref:roadblock/LC7 domain-containing protein n=1 Tax=Actinomadura sp. KC216 TaxID=2530370 RepID=UPI00104BAC36|nr:roadblock/LC7 domain-containing protein [Actinomadura sp. KC216]TDB88841.1 roadblock/LC7 domain-containing protein [Actinomadura sp. KC216]